MLVTPEGTRARQEQWKTGFIMWRSMRVCQLRWLIWIMQKAGVGKIIYPTGNYEQDMAEIMTFYANIEPKFPEKFSIDQRYF